MLAAALVRRGQFVPRMNSVYALILSTWFAFRQSAQLDASDVYVPHPWQRAWLGASQLRELVAELASAPSPPFARARAPPALPALAKPQRTAKG